MHAADDLVPGALRPVSDSPLFVDEPAGDTELWRLLWERESIRTYLAGPNSYDAPPAVSRLQPAFRAHFQYARIRRR